MNNPQKGFVVPLLVALAIIVIGGGIYFYSRKTNPVAQNIVNTNAPANTIPAQNNSTVIPVSSVVTQIPSDWKTYTNDKFSFQFKYPASWSVTGEIGGTLNGTTYHYKTPYLLDMIIATEKSPINRAGHISVLSKSMTDFMAQMSKLPTGWSVKDSDLKTANLQGKKLIITHAPVTNPTSDEVSQQTDYSYILTLGDKTVLVNFMSINNPEKQISNDLAKQIDQFIATFSSK